MRDRVLTLLTGIPAMQALSLADREKIAAVATIDDLSAGTTMFEEGDLSEASWLVAKGRVSLGMRRAGRPDVLLLTLGPGDLLGWSALQAGGTRVASARVVEKATLIRLPRRAIEILCETDHDIGYALMRLAFHEVARRLQDTRVQLLDVYGKEPR